MLLSGLFRVLSFVYRACLWRCFVSGDRSLVTANSSSYTCYSVWTERKASPETPAGAVSSLVSATHLNSVFFPQWRLLEQRYFIVCFFSCAIFALVPHYVFCNRSTCIMVTPAAHATLETLKSQKNTHVDKKQQLERMFLNTTPHTVLLFSLRLHSV